MLKLMGVLMVFAGCSLTGIVLDFKYRKRIKELENFIYAFEYLKGEIDYRLTPLEEACYLVGGETKHDIGKVFITFSKLLGERTANTGSSLWKEALEREKYKYDLTAEDYSILEEFGRGIGQMDKKMQQANINLIQGKLKMTLDLALKEHEKTGKLRTGMGILVGACISILII